MRWTGGPLQCFVYTELWIIDLPLLFFWLRKWKSKVHTISATIPNGTLAAVNAVNRILSLSAKWILLYTHAKIMRHSISCGPHVHRPLISRVNRYQWHRHKYNMSFSHQSYTMKLYRDILFSPDSYSFLQTRELILVWCNWCCGVMVITDSTSDQTRSWERSLSYIIVHRFSAVLYDCVVAVFFDNGSACCLLYVK